MTAEEAITLAKLHAESLGWPWRAPLNAAFSRRRRIWTIRSNVGSMGRNVVINIDDANAKIIDAHYLPR